MLYVIEYMYKCCNYFNWSLSCFLVLADWLSFYLFWVCYSLLAMRRTHIWLCVISVVYDYLFCEPDVFAPPLLFPPCIYYCLNFVNPIDWFDLEIELKFWFKNRWISKKKKKSCYSVVSFTWHTHTHTQIRGQGKCHKTIVCQENHFG